VTRRLSFDNKNTGDRTIGLTSPVAIAKQMILRRCHRSIATASSKWRRLTTFLNPNDQQASLTTLGTRSKKNDTAIFINDEVVVICHPGLESVLATELRALGLEARPVTKDSKRGRLIIQTTTVTDEDLFRCCLFLGSAINVRWKCASFSARGLAELRRKTANVNWVDYISSQRDDDTGKDNLMGSIDVRVSSSKSKLYHTGAIRERVLLGIYEYFGYEGIEDENMLGRIRTEKQGPDVNEDEDRKILLDAHIERDQVDIFINAYSTPLHQRGYRLQTAKAPLREDLAYAVLMTAGWLPSWIQKNESTSMSHSRRRLGLLDPFCGSGTIIIEGVTMAMGLPPGRFRASPFQGTIIENSGKWRDIVHASIPSNSEKSSSILVSASDRDAGAIKATEANARRAGVWKQIKNHLYQSSLSNQPWFENASHSPSSILVVTNPPFGKRVSKKSHLLPLYQTLGHSMQQLRDKNKRSMRGVILTDDPILVRKVGHGFGFQSKTILRFPHGGEKVWVMEWKTSPK
jgi:putative N6-adenine-specific DNA methylase